MSGVKNMTVGSPTKLFLAFSLPLMIGNIFQQLYTVVDTMVVGQVLGTTALAALGTTDWFNWMFLGIMSGLTQGFSILIAQKFGEGDLAGMRKATGNAILLSGIIAVLLVTAGEILVIPMLHILRAPEDVAPISEAYLRIVFGGMIVQSVVNGFGVLFIAAFTATNKLYGVLEIAAVSFGYAMTTYAGQNLGAGETKRIRQGTRAAVVIGAYDAVRACRVCCAHKRGAAFARSDRVSGIVLRGGTGMDRDGCCAGCRIYLGS